MFKTSIAINDQHIPYLDPVAHDLTLQLIKTIQPDYIDILGDLIDCWQISKFNTDPNRKEDVQQDIDEGQKYLKEIRELAPKATIELHYGNHLDRLRKYIWRKGRELACIRSLDFKFLLGLKELNINTVEDETGYTVRGNLCLTHGTIVSQDSGMTARRMLRKYGLSVIHGHTHRMGSIFKTDLLGYRGAWENGCLCKYSLIKEWGGQIADWQQGCSVIYFSGSDRFLVQALPIIKGKMLFGSQEFVYQK